MKLIRYAAFFSALVAAPVAGSADARAQGAPVNWKVSPDSPAKLIGSEVISDTTVFFITMAPGWHMTMGPGGLIYDTRYFAEGRFDAEIEIFIFPDASNEEMGLFLGGKDLDATTRSYTAFVVRRDGSAAVVRRDGARETMLHPWTANAAILGPDKTGKNVLRVTMDSAGVHYIVNGARIGTWPRADMALDGHFGFRVGKRVNLHATRLDVMHRLGPLPRGK